MNIIPFVSCILCWIIGVIMGADKRVTVGLADEVLKLRAEQLERQCEEDKGEG